MKPLRLLVRAFGPYAGEQTFDFADLQGRSFFLIHGPTGAGKTTILDAMCYSLYGETSGAERDADQMRSHHASPDVVTEVQFDFQLGAHCYRVHRMPEQERPRKRGGGTTTQNPEATLWRVDADKAETVLADKPLKVREAVERIFNFKSEQFRQVVMLPQGKFRELLLAKSDEREEILKALFQTELYEKIQEALKERAKALRVELESVQRERELLLRQAGVEKSDDLHVRCRELDARKKELIHQQQEAGLAEKQAQDRLMAARKANELVLEQKQATLALALIDHQEPHIQARQTELAAARQAISVASVEQLFETRRREKAERQGESTKAQHACAIATTAADTALRTLEDAQAREPERLALESTCTRLREMESRVQQLSIARTEAGTAEKTFQAADRRYTTAKATVDGLQTQVDTTQRALGTLQGTAAAAPGRKLAAQNARDHLKKRQDLDTIQADLRTESAIQAKAAERLQKCQEAEQAARTQLEQLQHAWASGQAGLLAGTLVPGSPCPVCGATTHPQKATPTPDMSDQSALDQQKALCERATAALQTALQAHQKAENEILVLRTRAEGLLEALTDVAQSTLAELAKDAERLAAHAAEAEAAVSTASRQTQALEQLRGKLETAKSELATFENARQSTQKAAQHAKGLAEGQSAVVPPEYRDPATLVAALSSARTQAQRLKDALDQASKAHAKAENDLAGAKARQELAVAALGTAHATLQAASGSFEKGILDAGFAHSEDYRLSKRTSAEIEALDAAINAFKQQREAARQRVNRAQSAAQGLAAVDLARFEADVQRAKSAREAAIGEAAGVAKSLEQAVHILAELDRTATRITALDADYARFGRLAEVATGQNTYRVTFQRYVLGWLLEDVLAAASLRLRAMTKSRYTLRRKSGPAEGRAGAGLDLEVDDAHTGVSRAVATLSGGESFLASLALALGLADVVQGYAGGIHLQTMFIDEGFGSLDPEALDLAIQSLVDLQAGGRLVGIISHVPELCERIDARLEITAGRQGSRAQFILA